MRKIKTKPITEDGEKSLNALIGRKKNKAERALKAGDEKNHDKLLQEVELLEKSLGARKNM